MVKSSNVSESSFEMLHEALGEHSLIRAGVFEWHSRFKAG
jgi:hypothetical protein